jgi:nucleoside-diphosphate-sugar epimerase
MTRVLVTGASGFIGRHLVPRLRMDGHDVVGVGRGSGVVTEAAAWERFPASDVVVHLAARSFVPDSWEAPAAFITTNLSSTLHALEYCRTHDAHLVFLSSYIYGDAAQQPVSESSAVVARNPYALSKKLGEEACEFFADRFRVRITVFRPFNIYGPGQPDVFLVPTIVNQLKSREEVRVRDLEPRRDYVYVLDVVEAIVRAVACDRGFRVFNLGSGVSHSVADLIRLMQEIWGTDLPVRSDGVRRKDEVMDTVADITRAKQQLGWTPRFSLRQGLDHLHAAP